MKIKKHLQFLMLCVLLLPLKVAADEPVVLHDSIRDLKVNAVKWSEDQSTTLFSKAIDIYPCMDCHESMEPNTAIRKLTGMHEEIEFKHNKTFTWCLDCHDTEDRNKLRLISGKLVSFTESYRVCAQCHGPKTRDWKIGIHGLRTGGWNKDKTMRNCAICHNPHRPKFGTMKPEPVPNPRRPKTKMVQDGQGDTH